MDLYKFIHINKDHETSIALQLKQQITWLIINEKLKAGDKLPSIHEMSKNLGVNLHTVRNAYHKLEKNGLVETRPSRGTHVLPFDLVQLTQSSVSQRTNTIGVIIPSITNPFYHSIIEGIEEVLEEDQSLLFLCNTHDDPQTAWHEFSRLAAKGVDGIIVISHDIGEVLSSEYLENQLFAGFPFVTIDWPDTRGYSVNVDLEEAGYQASQHLIEHGHHKIGLITFSVEAANIEAINQGFKRGLRQAGILLEKKSIIGVPGFDIMDGEFGAKQLLAFDDPPTALFAVSDTLAIGAMKAFKNSGLRIPEDIAVIGFNDTPLAQVVDPPLTTISAPSFDLGRTAAQTLIKLINKELVENSQIILSTSITIRQSCGQHTRLE